MLIFSSTTRASSIRLSKTFAATLRTQLPRQKSKRPLLKTSGAVLVNKIQSRHIMSRSSSDHANGRIAVIGAGSVGATIALQCLTEAVCSEIIVNDVNEDLAKAQVLDLQDAAFTSDIIVRFGSPADAAQADLLILTAGAKQKDGETRVDLIGRNKKIFQSIFDNLRDSGKFNTKAVVLVVSNPCDMMTYFAQKMSGLKHEQVIGSGTYLDTMRLRSQLGHIMKISGSSIEANVLGEHGDSQFVNWSAANIAGVKLDEVVEDKSWDETKKAEVAKKTQEMAYQIIKNKGVTQFGIAAVATTLARDILFDQHHVRTISSYSPEDDVYYGSPTVIGRGGVQRRIKPDLSAEEKKSLEKSIKGMKEVISQNQ